MSDGDGRDVVRQACGTKLNGIGWLRISAEDGSVDTGAMRAMVDWYYENGCGGIFASCQSSEIFYLTDAERVLKKMEESTGVFPGSFEPACGAVVSVPVKQ